MLQTFFLIFCMTLGFSEHKKVKALLFENNSCYAQNGVNGAFLDPKSTLDLFHKSLLMFLKLYPMTCLRNWVKRVKVSFRFLSKILIMLKWGKCFIFGSKINNSEPFSKYPFFLKIFLNLYLSELYLYLTEFWMFKEKFLLCPKWREKCNLGPQINIFEL